MASQRPLRCERATSSPRSGSEPKALSTRFGDLKGKAGSTMRMVRPAVMSSTTSGKNFAFPIHVAPGPDLLLWPYRSMMVMIFSACCRTAGSAFGGSSTLTASMGVGAMTVVVTAGSGSSLLNEGVVAPVEGPSERKPSLASSTRDGVAGAVMAGLSCSRPWVCCSRAAIRRISSWMVISPPMGWPMRVASLPRGLLAGSVRAPFTTP